MGRRAKVKGKNQKDSRFESVIKSVVNLRKSAKICGDRKKYEKRTEN